MPRITGCDWLQYVPADARRLRVLVMGMNPSEASWNNGKPYAHRSNSMWRVLAQAGLIISGDAEFLSLEELARLRGVAFCDLTVQCENLASVARRSLKNSGVDVSKTVTERAAASLHAGPPLAVALASKTVAEVFLKRSRVDFGPLGSAADIGVDRWWGESCTFWVVPSTSGLAAMPAEDRLAPYSRLACSTAEWLDSASS